MGNLVHNLLEESAKLYPEKIALSCKNETITYRQLDESSSRLASCLIENGVKAGSRVGVYLDKSVDAVIAILGILKSQACYVPLDPLSPAHRIGLIIKDCRLEHIVTSLKKDYHLKQLPAESPLRYLFFMDACQEEYDDGFSDYKVIFKEKIMQASSQLKETAAPKEGSLAYIIYTSGSTGNPKGVMVTHRAALAFIAWACDYLKVTKDDHLSAQAPFHFDLSIFDIYATLKAGATLHIIPQGLSAFPESLAKFIENEKISIWYSVPSVLIQLLLYGRLDQKDMSCLKKIIFAGEVFPVKYLRALMSVIPKAEYYNFYGPTETNVCTCYQVRSLPAEDQPVPIGKPCFGQSVFIVDEAGNLVNDGEIGELCVSGPTLMEGYWNDPPKTKSVFLKGRQYFGSWAYKTGDLVVRGKDGNLEYHGRRDNLIKSAGYRIEPGEIEATLCAHAKIKEAVVIGVPDEKIGKKVKAFVVPKESQVITENEINLFCSTRLPLYMVPKIAILKDGLPRASTGKIDINKLKSEVE